ncbi:MAG: hypothetical protein CMI03_03360 [Oceanospirillaceae bacterium]|nr:hypothetical protein [Oceanospirillaceae bacterium]
MHRATTIGQKLNISQICGLLMGTLVLICGLIISGLGYSQLQDQQENQLMQNARQQLQHLALAIAPSLLAEDRISLTLTLSEWKTGPELTNIQILNTSQQVIAEQGTPLREGPEISQSVTQDNMAAGLIRADIDLSAAARTARHYLAMGLIASGLMALLAALLAYQLTERVTAYLRRLEDSLGRWEANDDPLKLPDAPLLSDLKNIHKTLNRIAQREEHQKAMEQALGRFVSSQHSSTPSALRYHECALLFIEIQDLEILQQRLSAEELTSVLNHYHRLLSHAAKLYNGKVDRYHGTGIVMTFGIANPVTTGHEALHCLYAAQLFSGLVTHLRETDTQLLPVEFRMAAHWGNVLLAPVTHDEHTECNMIGDTVHWASHLADNGEELRLLASQTLLDHLPEADEIKWQEGPLISDLHGGEQACYWLQELSEKNHQLIQRQIRHITAMTEQA